jgi:hypothetical protein
MNEQYCFSRLIRVLQRGKKEFQTEEEAFRHCSVKRYCVLEERCGILMIQVTVQVAGVGMRRSG